MHIHSPQNERIKKAARLRERCGMPRMKWSELTSTQQRGLVELAAVEVVVTSVAAVDLARSARWSLWAFY